MIEWLLGAIVLLLIYLCFHMHYCFAQLYRVTQSASQINDEQMIELISEVKEISQAAARLNRGF